MNVSLTAALEEFVEEQVKSNRYQTASEVVRHALRLMQREEQLEQAQLEALRNEIKVGLDQLDRGEYIKGKDLTVERIRNLALKKFGSPSKPKRNGR